MAGLWLKVGLLLAIGWLPSPGVSSFCQIADSNIPNLYLTAGDLSTTDLGNGRLASAVAGERVVNWMNGYDNYPSESAGPAVGPSLHRHGATSMPYLRFSGAQQLQGWAVPSGDGEQTVCVLGSVDDPTRSDLAEQALIAGQSSSQELAIRAWAGSWNPYTLSIVNRQQSRALYQSASSFKNVTTLQCLVETPSQMTYYRDGTSLASSSTVYNPNYPKETVYFMMGQWGSGWLYGGVMEVFYFPRALSAPDREWVEGLMLWRYGLQSRLPSNHPWTYSDPGPRACSNDLAAACGPTAVTPLSLASDRGLLLTASFDGGQCNGTLYAPSIQSPTCTVQGNVAPSLDRDGRCQGALAMRDNSKEATLRFGPKAELALNGSHLTVCLWVRPTLETVDASVLASQGSPSGDFWLLQRDGLVMVGSRSDGTRAVVWVPSNRPLQAEVWAHVCAVMDAVMGIAAVYHNGYPTAWQHFVPLLAFDTAASPLCVGSGFMTSAAPPIGIPMPEVASSGPWQPPFTQPPSTLPVAQFFGDVDELKVYRRALRSDEIEHLGGGCSRPSLRAVATFGSPAAVRKLLDGELPPSACIIPFDDLSATIANPAIGGFMTDPAPDAGSAFFTLLPNIGSGLWLMEHVAVAGPFRVRFGISFASGNGLRYSLIFSNDARSGTALSRPISPSVEVAFSFSSYPEQRGIKLIVNDAVVRTGPPLPVCVPNTYHSVDCSYLPGGPGGVEEPMLDCVVTVRAVSNPSFAVTASFVMPLGGPSLPQLVEGNSALVGVLVSTAFGELASIKLDAFAYGDMQSASVAAIRPLKMPRGPFIINGGFERAVLAGDPSTSNFLDASAGSRLIPGWAVPWGQVNLERGFTTPVSGLQVVDTCGSVGSTGVGGSLLQTVTNLYGPDDIYSLRFFALTNCNSVSAKHDRQLAITLSGSPVVNYNVTCAGWSATTPVWRQYRGALFATSAAASSATVLINTNLTSLTVDPAYGVLLDDVEIWRMPVAPYSFGYSGKDIDSANFYYGGRTTYPLFAPRGAGLIAASPVQGSPEVAALWHASVVNVSRSFAVDFTISIGDIVAPTNAGDDGYALAFHRDPRGFDAMGAVGGSLAVHALPANGFPSDKARVSPAVALGFSPRGTLYGGPTAFWYRSTATDHGKLRLPMPPPIARTTHDVRVTYDDSTGNFIATVRISGGSVDPNAPAQAGPFSFEWSPGARLSTVLGAGLAFIGVTASSWGAYAQKDLTKFTVAPWSPPSSLPAVRTLRYQGWSPPSPQDIRIDFYVLNSPDIFLHYNARYAGDKVGGWTVPADELVFNSYIDGLWDSTKEIKLNRTASQSLWFAPNSAIAVTFEIGAETTRIFEGPSFASQRLVYTYDNARATVLGNLLPSIGQLYSINTTSGFTLVGDSHQATCRPGASLYFEGTQHYYGICPQAVTWAAAKAAASNSSPSRYLVQMETSGEPTWLQHNLLRPCRDAGLAVDNRVNVGSPAASWAAATGPHIGAWATSAAAAFTWQAKNAGSADSRIPWAWSLQPNASAPGAIDSGPLGVTISYSTRGTDFGTIGAVAASAPPDGSYPPGSLLAGFIVESDIPMSDAELRAICVSAPSFMPPVSPPSFEYRGAAINGSSFVYATNSTAKVFNAAGAILSPAQALARNALWHRSAVDVSSSFVVDLSIAIGPVYRSGTEGFAIVLHRDARGRDAIGGRGMNNAVIGDPSESGDPRVRIIKPAVAFGFALSQAPSSDPHFFRYVQPNDQSIPTYQYPPIPAPGVRTNTQHDIRCIYDEDLDVPSIICSLTISGAGIDATNSSQAGPFTATWQLGKRLVEILGDRIATFGIVAATSGMQYTEQTLTSVAWQPLPSSQHLGGIRALSLTAAVQGTDGVRMYATSNTTKSRLYELEALNWLNETGSGMPGWGVLGTRVTVAPGPYNATLLSPFSTPGWDIDPVLVWSGTGNARVRSVLLNYAMKAGGGDGVRLGLYADSVLITAFGIGGSQTSPQLRKFGIGNATTVAIRVDSGTGGNSTLDELYLTADFFGEPSTLGPSSCPPGFTASTSGYCYRVPTSTTTSWDAAEAACAATGATRAHLALPRDSRQLDAVIGRRCAGLTGPSGAATWTSVNDQQLDGLFVSSTGESTMLLIGSDSWAPGEPDGSGDCTLVDGASLYDAPCIGGLNRSRITLPCCEAPAGPLDTCPAGFKGPDASGYCYRGIADVGSYAAAMGACGVATGRAGWPATIIDSATALSVVTSRCFGDLSASTSDLMWVGLKQLSGSIQQWNGIASDYPSSAAARGLWAPGEPSGTGTCVLHNATEGLKAVPCNAIAAPVDTCCQVPSVSAADVRRTVDPALLRVITTVPVSTDPAPAVFTLTGSELSQTAMVLAPRSSAPSLVTSSGVRLTAAAWYQRAALWLRAPLSVAYSFTVTATIDIGAVSPSGDPGYMLVFHNDPRGLSAISGYGSSLGISSNTADLGATAFRSLSPAVGFGLSFVPSGGRNTQVMFYTHAGGLSTLSLGGFPLIQQFSRHTFSCTYNVSSSPFSLSCDLWFGSSSFPKPGLPFNFKMNLGTRIADLLGSETAIFGITSASGKQTYATKTMASLSWQSLIPPTPSPSASPSRSSSPSVSPPRSRSPSASPSRSPSPSATSSTTASTSASPSATATVSPSLTPSTSPISPSSTRSASSTITSSQTPAPSTPVRISLRFEGGVHSSSSSATASGSTSVFAAVSASQPSGSLDEPPPLSVVHRGWLLPQLRVSITRGCIGTDAPVVLQCRPTDMLSPDVPSPISVSPSFVQLRRSSTGCALFSDASNTLSTSAVFSLFDQRVWPYRSYPAEPGTEGGCFLSDRNSTSGGLLRGPADYGYSSSRPKAVKLRCSLVALPATAPVTLTNVDDALVQSSSLLAAAHAAVLVLPAPMLIPRDLMVLRPSSSGIGTLQSMLGSSTMVPRLGDSLQRLTSPAAKLAAAAVMQPGFANATKLALHRSIALAAEELVSRPRDAVSSAAPSLALSGSATLVLVLDTRASPVYPELDRLLAQYQEESSSLKAAGDALAQAAAASGDSVSDEAAALLRSRIACTDASGNAALLNELQVLRSSTPVLVRPAVYVGAVRAEVLWSAPDGSQLHVKAPSFAELCKSAPSGDCGYQPISLRYEGLPIAAARLLQATSSADPWGWLAAWLTDGGALVASGDLAALESRLASIYRAAFAAGVPQARIGVPPLYPDWSVPLAVAMADAGSTSTDGAWQGVLVPASAGGLASSSGGNGTSSSSSMSLRPLLSSLTSSSSMQSSSGLYYTSQCVGFTSIETGACTNTSHPDFSNCAFGAGDDCRPCSQVNGKAAAVCPGGTRAQPLPGFYSATESSGIVIACSFPSQERCVGWSSALSAVQCGEGYRQFSYACSSCDVGYYPAETGACAKCPSGTSVGPIATTILMIGGSVLLAVAVIFGLTYLIAKAVGGTLQGGWQRALDLLVYSVMLLQVIAAVGRTAAPGLPPFIQSLFRALSALQFESVSLPSDCWQLYPFASEVIQMTAVLAVSIALCGWIVYTECQRRRRDKAPLTAGKKTSLGTYVLAGLPTLGFSALSLLYSLVCTSVFKLLSCKTVTLNQLAWAALNKDSPVTVENLVASSTFNAKAVVTVSVLAGNQNFVCWEASHRPAGVLAILTLLAYVLPGYLLWSWLWARHRIKTLATASFKGFQVEASAPATQLPSTWAEANTADKAAMTDMQRRKPLVSRALMFCFGRQRTAAWLASGPAGDKAVRYRSLSIASSLRAESDGLVPMTLNTVPGNFRACAMDASFLVATEGGLAHFTSTYRASVLIQRQVDLLSLAALAALLVFWMSPQTYGEVIARGFLNVLVLLSSAWFSATRRPFHDGDAWKLWVKVASLILAALAAVLTHLALYDDLSSRGGGNTTNNGGAPEEENLTARRGLSFAVFSGSVLLVLILFIGFVAGTIQGARVESASLQIMAASARAQMRKMADQAKKAALTLRSSPKGKAAVAVVIGEGNMLHFNPLASSAQTPRGPSDAKAVATPSEADTAGMRLIVSTYSSGANSARPKAGVKKRPGERGGGGDDSDEDNAQRRSFAVQTSRRRALQTSRRGSARGGANSFGADITSLSSSASAVSPAQPAGTACTLTTPRQDGELAAVFNPVLNPTSLVPRPVPPAPKALISGLSFAMAPGIDRRMQNMKSPGQQKRAFEAVAASDDLTTHSHPDNDSPSERW